MLAVPLLLAPLSTWMMAPLAGTQIEITTSIEDVDDQLAVQLRLVATPPLQGGWLDVSLETPEGVEAPEGTERRIVVQGETLPPTEVRYRPHRPVFVRLAAPRVRWRDPLGLGELELAVRDPHTTLERYPPEVRRIPRMVLQRTTLLPGEVRSRIRSAQGEFTSIRDYQSGDSPRQINWWASARRGSLASNDFVAERSGEMVLVVDARPTPLPGGDDVQLLGVARAAALGLARYLLREKTRVGLAIFGEFVRVVPLGTGRVQRYRVERELESTRLAAEAGPIERLAVSLSRHFPPGTPVLFITPLIDPETLIAGYYLRRRGYPALILAPSPTTLEAERMNLKSAEGPLALRLLRLIRRRNLSEAWESAPVVEWEDFTSLAALVEFLRRPPTTQSGVR